MRKKVVPRLKHSKGAEVRSGAAKMKADAIDSHRESFAESHSPSKKQNQARKSGSRFSKA